MSLPMRILVWAHRTAATPRLLKQVRAREAGPVLIRVAVARAVRAARIRTLEGLSVFHHTGCTEDGSQQEASGQIA